MGERAGFFAETVCFLTFPQFSFERANRLYLSQYCTQQGIHYNTYINNLRIDHFVNLYRKATASGKSFTAQQLADGSGYRSYSTFSHAFKQRMGETVTAWMHETAQ